MNCHIILVGSELLNGMMVDTNSVYMAEELNKYGIEIVAKSIIGDKIDEIVSAITYAKTHSDLVILSGGLGPTIDDLTRDAIAKYLGKDLILFEDELLKLKKKFKKISIEMPDRNVRQVMFPEGSTLIKNERGAAPAFYIDEIVSFPGVPTELKETFPRFLKYLKKEKKLTESVFIKDILIWGLPESQLENKIIDIVKDEKDVFVEFLVKDYGTILRLLTKDKNKEKALEIKEKVYSRVGDNIFGEDDDRLEKLLIKYLREKSFTISMAESCTGGLLSSLLVSVSGVSSLFSEAFVTYSNEAKIRNLGVREETLKNYGAVSEETVKEMLDGLTGEVKIAISGIAGPNGGTETKPIGTVYIGSQVKEKINITRYLFRGERDKVREKASLTAIYNTIKLLKE